MSLHCQLWYANAELSVQKSFDPLTMFDYNDQAKQHVTKVVMFPSKYYYIMQHY